ncbi:PREDICTED: uncharacterized protein LOC107184631 [Myotis davidii]|uniref:uncharacterized protein LOC107184631 n=1 Tax=Myotis davidii TaxID=225400 RepID=UPI000766F422|nr:PREDICTED: uncharacterized protein LOC107184631 [Myotis davidii]
MPRLRLLSAGGPGPTTLSTHAAAGRARAEPRPGAQSGLGQVGIRTQGQRSRTESAFSLVPVLRTFSVARAHPGREQGEDKQQIQGAARAPPPPGLALSPRAQGPGRAAGFLWTGARKDPLGLSPERSALCKRSSGCISDAIPWLCLQAQISYDPVPRPCYFKNSRGKMCSGAVLVCAAQGSKEARAACRQTRLSPLSLPSFTARGGGVKVCFSLPEFPLKSTLSRAKIQYGSISPVAIAMCPKWAPAQSSSETRSLLALEFILVFSMEWASEIPQDRLSHSSTKLCISLRKGYFYSPLIFPPSNAST